MIHRVALLLLFWPLAGGCVTVPEAKYADGRPTPAAHLAQLIREGRVVPGKTPIGEVSQLLIPDGNPPTGQSYDGWSRTPHVYENPGARQLAMVYQEPARAFGVTLNQHFLYLPMPLLGVEVPQTTGLFLSYDGKNVLKNWWRRSEPDLHGFTPAAEQPAGP